VLGLDNRRDEVAMKRQVAYASPETSYRGWNKVSKLIRFVRGFYPSWDGEYCRQLLQKLKIKPDDSVTTLSLGTRIKLGLVLALSWHPKVLILDEPTAGLDAVSKKQIFSELLEAMKDEERTVLISSHGLNDLERFADNIGMIKNGKLLIEGATSDFMERFQLVDFVMKNGEEFEPPAGFFPQKREGERWQALVDMRKNSAESLEARGATKVSATPVTLEDVFVALAGEESE
jgi:ABC-2 type transport system ATP-binding protein